MKLAKTVTAITLLVMPLSLLRCTGNSENSEIPEPTDAALIPAGSNAMAINAAASAGSDEVPDSSSRVNAPESIASTNKESEHVTVAPTVTGVVTVPNESAPERMWTFEEKVTIRSAPSFEAKDVGTLGYGEPVTGVEQDKGWVKIGEGQYVARQNLTDRKSRFFRHQKRKRHAH